VIGPIGSVGVLVGVASAVLLLHQAIATMAGSRLGSRNRIRFAARGLLAGGVIAMGALIAGLLLNDFSISYIADNHARATPFPFNIATAWAALEGSIVLWGLVLAGFVAWVDLRVGDDDRLGFGAMAVLAVAALFFFGLMATVSNPFMVLADVPIDGPGPNPLLQNHLLMAIHPPLLYIGLVGFTVPFAFGISALVIGEGGVTWLRRTRHWSLVAWTFLTIGIIMGGWWSYEVLGWGGFWAWDPVENASFLPWLTGTAFIHSAAVQVRRGMLQAWNLVLVISTFALTILATFLTRSGVISSVHSFSFSLVGPALLGFLALIVVGSFTLFALRAHRLAEAPRLESLASREGVFLANNLLFTVFAFVVLTGTMYPLLFEAFTGSQVSVGRPFFDRMAIPLSYALLLAMGIGPVTPYRLARGRVVWDRVRRPVIAAFAVGAAVVVAGLRVGHVVLVIMLGTFVTATIASTLWTSAGKLSTTGRPRSMLRVMRNDPAYWGGQIAHFGVILVAVAIAMFGNLATRTTATLEPGETVTFAGYELTYQSPFQREGPNRTAIGARLGVFRDGEQVGVLEPQITQFRNQVQAVGTPAVRSDLTGNLYVTLGSIDEARITIQILRHPMLSLLWVGGLIMTIGGLWAWLARKPRRVRPQGDTAAPTPAHPPEVPVDA